MSETLVKTYVERFREHSTYLWVVSHPLPGFALLASSVLTTSDNDIVRQAITAVTVPWLLSGPALALACIAVAPPPGPTKAHMLLVSAVTMPVISALTFILCFAVPTVAFPLFFIWLYAARRAVDVGLWD